VRLPMSQRGEGEGGVAWEIAPEVYCLGPWGRTQTNVYFVCSGSSWVLIDAGWASDGPQLLAAKLTDSTASAPVPRGECAQRDSFYHRQARTLNGCVSHHEASPRPGINHEQR
jgi:hypothetical protein